MPQPAKNRAAVTATAKETAAKETAAKETTAAYTPMLRDLPLDLRPRERMLMAGPAALSNAELLAILLRVGVVGESVIHVAENLLARFGGLPGLAQANFEELCSVNGVGEANAAKFSAAGMTVGGAAYKAAPAVASKDVKPAAKASAPVAKK